MLKKLSFKEINSIRRNKIKSEYNKLKLFKKNVKTKKKKRKNYICTSVFKTVLFCQQFFWKLIKPKKLPQNSIQE